MNRHPEKPSTDRPELRARLQALLFTGAAIGAAVVTAGLRLPKLPPGDGE